MTQTEMTKLLHETEALQRQLTNIITRIRNALTADDLPTAKDFVPATLQDASRDPMATPDHESLAALSCPKCQAPLRWQWSHANGVWFAGCSMFATQRCRGSLSFAKVMAPENEAVTSKDLAAWNAPRTAEPDESKEGPMHCIDDRESLTDEDLERIEKHHGTEAAASLLRIPF